VNRSGGVVKVEQLTLVLDAGPLFHADGALAQAEGASLWGPSMALHEGTEFVNGQVCDTNLNTYSPPRMHDVPMDIEFIASTAPPTGLGAPIAADFHLESVPVPRPGPDPAAHALPVAGSGHAWPHE
jgi:isoquinoline 1-oxidoreductase subunit beta